MKLKLFSTFDSKVQAWTCPFFRDVIPGSNPPSTDILSLWSAVANDKQHAIGQNPSDYCLFEIAEFDSFTGKISPHQSPISIGVAITFVNENVSKLVNPEDSSHVS